MESEKSVKFLVDAQLPRQLVRWLRAAGHDGIHTRELPDGNRTADDQINEISSREQRIVITKDVDFVDSFLLHRQPYKLLLISTGNIDNAALEAILSRCLPDIVAAFDDASFIELNHAMWLIHT